MICSSEKAALHVHSPLFGGIKLQIAALPRTGVAFSPRHPVGRNCPADGLPDRGVDPRRRVVGLLLPH